VFFALFSSQNLLAEDRNGLSAYIGLGPLYIPSAYKIGWRGVEVGKLNSSTIGIASNYFSDNIYASFGLGVMSQGITSPGFYAALGYERFVLWNLIMRIEMNANASVNGQESGELQFGLGWRF
jgi:hypothetical protein